MMYNVRCQGCLESIGKGVRFNARKKMIGKFLSTKIYEFTMTCHMCSHELVVKTHPESCDFMMVRGL